jgi:hypothetical protein
VRYTVGSVERLMTPTNENRPADGGPVQKLSDGPARVRVYN